MYTNSFSARALFRVRTDGAFCFPSKKYTASKGAGISMMHGAFWFEGNGAGMQVIHGAFSYPNHQRRNPHETD